MKEKTLFEIPIYSMSKKVFDDRWTKYKTELYENFMKSGHTPESAKEGISRCCHPKDIWKYNHIIGFITISVSSNDVWFNVFCSMDKRYCFDSSRKHFIQDWNIGGCHFYVSDDDLNECIKEQIKQWLGSVQNDHLGSRYFVDFSAFENTFQYMDIRKAIDSLAGGII